MATSDNAPGKPGIAPRWTSSAKTGVGTSLNPASRVWFTLSHGILNEVYYPRVDQACTRDLGLIVTDGQDFFSEEKRHTNHEIACLATGVPAYQLTNTCRDGRYRVVKQVYSDPRRDVVLQQIQFSPLEGSLDDYHLYVLLAPHLGNQGAGNSAWPGDYKGNPMLFAQQEDTALALAASVPWARASAGYVGASDGWQDLSQHKLMTWTYGQARDGNVALTGEVDLSNSDGRFVLAMGFGENPSEAGERALASLMDDPEATKSEYLREWQSWQERTLALGKEAGDGTGRSLYAISTAVLRSHEAKRFPGGIIASLSIPWGSSKGDDDLGGYHLVWPRDLVEAAGGLLAAGAEEDARRVIQYLKVTQEEAGNWPQNMWLDGRPFWSGIQMDETAFPILLVDLARREGAVADEELGDLWSMVRRAAGFLVRNGPVTQQDRWEEDPGYSPFTLAVEITALLLAADLAESQGENEMADYLRQTADAWNANIERWTYVTDSDLARDMGLEGYYVRIAPPEAAEASSPSGGFVPIKNRPPSEMTEPAAHIVSPDMLALVRFGLRRADDPRILNTLKIIDAQLKVETPNGPAWHRYDDDGYGEHEDGSDFDGTGIGRAWPLLTGERAHYELAAGHDREARRLLAALEAFSNPGGLIPEQIWDSEDIPEKELFCGRPSGSAMPLVWAHSEYVKLLRSLRDGRVFDTPPQTVQRYIEQQVGSRFCIWRFNQKPRSMPAGTTLRLEVLAPATVHWTADNWQTRHDIETENTKLGVHLADVDTTEMPAGAEIKFTFYWPDESRWEGSDYSIQIRDNE